VFNSFKIPVAFLLTGVIWALFSDPLIAYITTHTGFTNEHLFRKLSEFAFVVTIAFILYFEIKKYKLKLSRSEKEYRHLFESNPNPMWIYNHQTLRFIKVNNAAIEKYKFSRSMFLKMTINDIRPSEEYDRQNAHLISPAEIVRRKGIWRHLKASGEVFYVSLISQRILFNNEPCGLVMATDITEILDKDRKIRSANEALQQISWSNSHELRKPLCSILGLVSLLKYSTDEHEQKEMLHLLEECSLELDVVVRKNNEKVTEVDAFNIN
jgi:PAS domain S-box-containing protein